jgi:hypothetical protein
MDPQVIANLQGLGCEYDITTDFSGAYEVWLRGHGPGPGPSTPELRCGSWLEAVAYAANAIEKDLHEECNRPGEPPRLVLHPH